DGLIPEPSESLGRVNAAVVELDPLADPVRAGAEDDDARLLPVRRRFVRFAPGGVVVARGCLDLACARVHTAIRRTNAAGAAASPDRVLAHRGDGRDLGVRPAAALQPEEVVGDQVVERELVELVRELGVEPGMRALRQLPRLAAVELARAPGLAEGLEERAADAHCLADRLHLRAERGVGARELLEG